MRSPRKWNYCIAVRPRAGNPAKRDFFTPKRRDAGNQKQDSHRNTGNHKNSKLTWKGVDIMKGLEIAIIIIGCGMKILEVLEEA